MNYSEKQLHILNTAERLFAHRGFDGSSIRDIAEEAGVNIAMISYYFGSKEKLMQALFQERASYIKLKLENLLKDEKLSPWEKIEIIIDGYLDRIIQKQQFYKIMTYEQILKKNTVITDLLNDLKKRNAELIDMIIKDGQEKGIFKKDVDTLLLVDTMTGVAMQIFINKDYYKTYYNLQSHSEEEFMRVLKEIISNHIKVIFKAVLNYEA